MRKRMFMLLIGILSVVLVACGDDDAGEADTEKEDEQDSPAVEVALGDYFFDKFATYGEDEDTVGVYAELKNTGDVAAVVPEVEVTMYDGDDKMLSVDREQETLVGGSLISPTVIEPDSRSYIAFAADIEDKHDDLDNIDIDYEAKPVTEEDAVPLDVDEESINVMGELQDDDAGEETDESAPVSDVDMTFRIENNHDKDYDYEVGIGLYNDDDELIGTMLDLYYINVDYTVASGEDKNLEVEDTLPVDIDNVDHVDVRVIGVEPTGEEELELDEDDVEDFIEEEKKDKQEVTDDKASSDDDEQQKESDGEQEDDEQNDSDKREVDGDKTSALDDYSAEEIEYARIWMQFMTEQDITELNVNKVAEGTPINPHVDPDNSYGYPEDVVILTADYTAQGILTYGSNGDGTINIYPMPSQFPPVAYVEEAEGMTMYEYTKDLSDRAVQMAVDPLNDNDVAEFLDSITIKYM